MDFAILKCRDAVVDVLPKVFGMFPSRTVPCIDYRLYGWIRQRGSGECRIIGSNQQEIEVNWRSSCDTMRPVNLQHPVLAYEHTFVGHLATFP